MVPNTYLLTAPEFTDAFGMGMSSSELIRGLKLANPKVVVPAPHAYTSDSSAATGTGIWLGQPKAPGSTFICGMDCGQIPEWTQIEPVVPGEKNGRVIIRGWRAILQRCVTSGVASRSTLERIFKVDLLVGNKSRFCHRCSRAGQWTPATSASGLCDDHDAALQTARLRAQE